MRLILAIWLALSAVAAPPLFRAQNVPGGGFLPSDLPDLALWLDADDASTLTLSGSVVDEWRDKSGNGRHFTGSGSARPALVAEAYNGRDAIQFDGVNDQLAIGSSGLGRNVGGVTIYIQWKWATSPTGAKAAFVISRTVAGSSRCGIGGGTWAGVGTNGRQKVLGRRLDSDSFQWTETAGAIGTGYQTTTEVFDYSGAILSQYINGALDGQDNPFQTAGNTSDTDSVETAIGNSSASGTDFSNIEIAEILVYHAAHDAATRAQVEAYLTR